MIRGIQAPLLLTHLTDIRQPKLSAASSVTSTQKSTATTQGCDNSGGSAIIKLSDTQQEASSLIYPREGAATAKAADSFYWTFSFSMSIKQQRAGSLTYTEKGTATANGPDSSREPATDVESPTKDEAIDSTRFFVGELGPNESPLPLMVTFPECSKLWDEYLFYTV